MTTTENLVQILVRLDVDAAAPTFSKAMSHLQNASIKELDRVGFDHRLRELMRLRASQLNGCAYCVDMHTKDARALGETEQRLYAVSVWRESPFYTARERAALAFAEQVTLVANTHVPDEAYAAVAEEFSDDEIGAMISLLVTINAWNAIGVSARPWEPGSYQP